MATGAGSKLTYNEGTDGMTDRYVALFLAAYIVGGAATAGVVAANREDLCAARWHNDLNPSVMMAREACITGKSAAAAVIWPGYWIAKIARSVAQ